MLTNEQRVRNAIRQMREMSGYTPTAHEVAQALCEEDRDGARYDLYSEIAEDMLSMNPHSDDIDRLRKAAETGTCCMALERILMLKVVADLLEMHDATGISLDDWTPARELAEMLIGHPVRLNGA